MTGLGKILTVLLFFLSLVFLGFAVTINRLNKDPESKGKSWFEVAKSRKQEVQDAYKDLAARDEEVQRLRGEIAGLNTQLGDERKARLSETAAERARALRFEAEVEEVRRDFAQKQQAADDLANELIRRREEAQRLSTNLKAKESQINEMVDQIARADTSRIQTEIENKTLRDRLESTENELRQASITLANIREQGVASVAPSAQKLVANPPPENVRGQIRRIEDDLVEISIGSDDGILQGHTLEVFNLQRQQYLGVIRIEAVAPDQAVGKIVLPQYKKKIQIGDTVASRIVPLK